MSSSEEESSSENEAEGENMEGNYIVDNYLIRREATLLSLVRKTFKKNFYNY